MTMRRGEREPAAHETTAGPRRPSSATRRRVLRSLLLLPAAAWGWAAAVRVALAQEAPKATQQSVAYQGSPNGDEKCSNCAQFVEPDACKVVQGPISPDGWCKVYTAKRG